MVHWRFRSRIVILEAWACSRSLGRPTLLAPIGVGRYYPALTPSDRATVNSTSVAGHLRGTLGRTLDSGMGCWPLGGCCICGISALPLNALGGLWPTLDSVPWGSAQVV